ncbi:hypothetical protein R3P38DRAFT_3497903, partial [Favolaschia claudopus]
CPIRDQLRTVDSRDLSDDPDEGPPESEGNSADGTEHQPHISNGFVPNINSRSTEIEQLRAAASHHNNPVILTMPFVHATPMNEHGIDPIAINAFPTLFPNGEADFKADREIKVSMAEWAAHLI